MADNQTQMKRVNLDTQITVDEYDSITVILKRKNIAEHAMQTLQFPKDTDQAAMKAFYQAGFDNFAQAQGDEQKWWREMSQKYGLDNKTYFDIRTGQFYKNAPVEQPKEE